MIFGDQFHWFMGVVEDRNDPLEMGRVRVRCFGKHTPNKSELPTEDLPWATPLQAVTSAAVEDIGETPTGIVEGSWVVGFFMDGTDAQRPIVMGTIAGIPAQTAQEQNYTSQGFIDPNGLYPSRKEEQDFNRLARTGEKHIIESGLQSEAVKNIGIALSETKWDSPVYENNAQYPFNHVYQSESGHIREFDDTPNSQRTLNLHRAGTYTYRDSDGNETSFIRNSKYLIVADDENIYINGNSNITINGDYNLHVGGNMNLQIDGKLNINAANTINFNQTGTDAKFTFGGNLDTKIIGNEVKSANNSDETIIHSKNIKTEDLNVYTIGTYKTTAEGPYHIRYDDSWFKHIGANTYITKSEGVDHTCPADPVRTSDTSCKEPDEASIASVASGATSPTLAVIDVTLDPYSVENMKPILNAVFETTTPSLREIGTVTVLDQVVENETSNTIFNCTDFPATLTSADYSKKISTHFTLSQLSKTALFPHTIKAQNGLTEGQIACNLKKVAENILEPLYMKYGNSFRVNSGFRQRRNGRSDRSSGRSDHEYGQAVDLQFPGLSKDQTREIAKWARDNIPSYKQLIFENIGVAGGWIHIAYAGSRGINNKTVLTTNNGSTYNSGIA
jgi:uncharacterized protein YcbK (DUF882 family)